LQAQYIIHEPPPSSPTLAQSLVGSPKSSGMPPIADVSTQRSPARAGLNSQEPPKVSTASRYRSTA
jgi:hypothetical protein